MNRRDRRAAGKSSPTNPTSSASHTFASPLSPAALYQAGFAHLRAGRPLDAQICCQQSLAIDPNHGDSLHLLGILSLQAGQYDHAVEWLARAIRQNPRTDYFSTLGITLQNAGRTEESLKVFDKAIQLAPDNAELWKNLAGVLTALDRPAEALLAYQHVLTLNPRHWEAAYHSGLLLHAARRFEEALVQLDLSDACQPDHAATLAARARSLRSLKQFERCLADNERAHALDPGNSVICNNLGDALLQLDRPLEALAWFDKSLALKPDFIEVLVNRGFAAIQLHRFDEALKVYQRAQTLEPDNAKAAYHLAHLQLLLGDYATGWASREARWRMPEHSAEYPKFSQPQWLGKELIPHSVEDFIQESIQESIEGKTVLVHFDEGLGDTIQFARYVPLLAARGARVVLVVQDALHPLMSGLPDVAACLPSSVTTQPGFQMPAFDYHCPTMSLPLAFGTTLQTIPPANYLPPVATERMDVWRKRLGAQDRLRVGLVWSGNPKQGNDRNRSMPSETLTPLLDLDATFISLQKDPRPRDQALLLRGRTDIVDLTADCTDFADTAALVASVDVVITVCTGVAHLAATMGRPTWVLLPYVPDWRWLLNRDDSPWYPTVRLFRQSDAGDYASVIDRVRTELMAEIAKFEIIEKPAIEELDRVVSRSGFNLARPETELHSSLGELPLTQ